jgi:ribonuclease HI
MELLAVIIGLESIKTKDHPIEIYSDSKYVIDSITKRWVNNWKLKGFKGKKNKDLWLRYLDVQTNFKLTFHWVKGHAGHPENERCDVLAYNAASNNPKEIDTEFEKAESDLFGSD